MTSRKSTAPAQPKRDRSGYYAIDGQKLLSVTTILGKGIPKPALMHWAAKEVALAAVESAPQLARMRGGQAREQMVDHLKRAAERKRDTAAELGSLLHRYFEATALGEPAPDVPEDVMHFVSAHARFLADYAPDWEASELVVANLTDGWAGTLDGIGSLPLLGPGLSLVDYKTGRGVYGEAGLQMAAYRRAEAGWLRDGTKVELPQGIERAVVVHVRPDAGYPRGYAVYPMVADDEAYQMFLAAKGVAEHCSEPAVKALRGDALPDITSTHTEAENAA